MISRLKNQQEKLIINERHEAWGNLARKLAHEIKNPLTPLQLTIDRLKNKYTEQVKNSVNMENVLIISADIENQINQLNNDEKENFMKVMGIKKTGLNNLTNKGYKLLELNTFFTSGPEESRAWTIEKHSLAPTAAGKIHTDFEKGFIRAETVSYDDFLDNDGWVNSKNNGKMRLEGKDYIVKDGDILNIRFNS